MARLLLKRGEPVALLVMIDTYPPGRRKQAPFKDRIIIHYDNLRPMSGKQRLNYVQVRWNQYLLHFSRLPILGGLLPWTIPPEKRHFAVSRLARYNYDPAPYPGDMLLIRASERPEYMNWDPMENWPAYVSGALQSYPVQGRHDSILFEPYVQDLARVLEGQITKALAGL